MPGELHIEAEIRRAWTLPARVYHEVRYLDAARRAVFARGWQLAADRDQVRVPGQVLPVTLLEGFLDEPLLFTRDREDQLRCLSNVCTHRGNLVVEAAGMGKHLRCRYHGRRFGLDGGFQFMPEFEAAEGFPCPSDDLPAVPFAAWGKLLFAALDPAVPFAEWIAPVQERLAWYPMDQLRFDPGRSRDYLVRANWALYCDNYLEGFHIPFVHAGLAETLDYGSYRTELFPHSNLQLGVAEDGEEAFDLPPSSPDHGQRIAAYYFWLFPNTMLNFYPWGLSVNVVKPLAVDRTRVSFLSYILDETRLEHGAGSILDRVEREDEAVVENVQRGVRSRFYDRGRYSPTREQGVHHFHRLLAEALNRDGSQDGRQASPKSS